MSVLFKNITVVTVDDDHSVIKNAYVGVQGQKIHYIGQELPTETYDEVIDGTHKVLMPSLYSAHSHIGLTLLRGYADEQNLQDWLENSIWPIENIMTEEMVRVSTSVGIAECIAGGILSCTDMYFHQGEHAQLCLDIGVMANFTNGILTFDEQYDPSNDRSMREINFLLENYHGKGDGRLKADISLHAVYTSPPSAWEYAVEKAKKHNLNMHIHLSETEFEQLECIKKHGKTPTQILNDYKIFDQRATAAHCVWLSGDDMDILAEKNVTAAHCPSANLKLASGVMRFEKMKEHNVRIALAHDSSCATNSNDMFGEMKLAAMLQKGVNRDPKLLTAKEAITMATRAGAYSQGREHESGMIKEGFDADLIVLDFDKAHLLPCYDYHSSIVYSAKPSDVWFSMCKGKTLYKAGEYKTLDIERVKHDMRALSKTLEK